MNENRAIVSKALPSESSQIETIHRNAFPQDFICDWLFLSPLVSRYIRKAIEAGDLMQTYPEFFTAKLAGNLAGYVNAKIYDESLSINYIAVAPKFQRQGIAKQLLTYIEVECQNHHHIKNITLDVDINNKPGLSLYKKLGYEIKYSKFLYEIPIDYFDTQQCSFEIKNWLEAEAWQYSYGFSYVMLSVNNSDLLKIGRLGNDYWRITDLSYIINYRGLTHALKSIEPNRSKIFVRSAQIISELPNRPINFLNMEKTLPLYGYTNS
ncbi:GNAT family N-acetyltransferase [Aerosakkonema sp. BLCC-F183]|uniref:GNAT family N-acetyltransferase n=1 Tax=Aerosakkonema sp. BLCC-F183 TaxID=3342834 RepID=UPI0035BC06B9